MNESTTPTIEEQYIASYQRQEHDTAAAWLRTMQESALDQFKKLGFPTISNEEWRFTNIAPFRKNVLLPAVQQAARDGEQNQIRQYLATADAPVIVLLDGFYSDELSSIPAQSGFTLQHYSAVSKEKPPDAVTAAMQEVQSAADTHPFAALNLAMLENFVTLEVPAGAQIQSPVHVIHLSRRTSGSQAQMAYPAFFVHAGAGSSVTLVEAFSGSDEKTYGVVSSTGIVIREGATVDHVRIQREGGKAFYFGLLAVRQERKSRYTAFSLALGGAIARTDVVIKIDGEECETMLDGLYVTAKEQLIDHHTFIEHLHPNCSSREIFKGIVAGKSRAVFNGKIYVHREAQGTDSKQTNKNLLLSDEATVDTKPQLEIFADDVKCTHGATVGGLDASALFYLKSRAIGEEAARDLLTLGFAGEVTSFIHNETVRHFVDTLIIAQLQATVTHTALPDIVH